MVGVSRNTARDFYHKLREIIAWQIEEERQFSGEIEVDESYFGILKRGGRVYTKIIPNASSKTLMPIIANKITPDSIVYTDSWRGYNALDVSDFKHFRINHSELFADGSNHINGIENFWN